MLRFKVLVIVMAMWYSVTTFDADHENGDSIGKDYNYLDGGFMMMTPMFMFTIMTDDTDVDTSNNSFKMTRVMNHNGDSDGDYDDDGDSDGNGIMTKFCCVVGGRCCWV